VQGEFITRHSTGTLLTVRATFALVTVLQQRVRYFWQPLALFSNKLNPAHQICSSYRRELLVIYEAVKHFRHILEARLFVIIAYCKPITCTFQQNREKCSPRQFTHFDFIAKFITDI
jgi:hypothetical protein